MPLKNVRICWYNDTPFENYTRERIQECQTFKHYFCSANYSIMDVNTVDITQWIECKQFRQQIASGANRSNLILLCEIILHSLAKLFQLFTVKENAE